MSLFAEPHQEFRGRVRRFIETRLTPHADEWENAGGFPRQLIRDLAEEGWFGLVYPREYGGQERDFAYQVVLAEELPRSRMMGLTLSIVAQAHFFLPLLASLGTAEQKREFMIPAIRGEKIGALASTEPSGGSDIARAVQCTARDDGDFWVLTGEKKFITNAPIADFIVVLARTRPKAGTSSLSLIIVPTDTPGFSVKETLRKLGMHSSPTGWVLFDDCRVPKRLTLGKPHVGFFYLMNSLLEERLIGAASGVALADIVLHETIDYVRHRPAYDSTLANLQTVRQRISEMAAEVEMSRRFVHSVCETYRDGKVEAKEICMIKFQVVEIVQRVVERCLQLHGGYGYLEENWLTRAYRDIRMLSVGGGASELMKDLVASYLRL
jgi:citronellyl-CoA dehydrogenase